MSGEHWTEEDDGYLSYWAGRGIDSWHMALDLDRSIPAVKRRCRKLGVLIDKPFQGPPIPPGTYTDGSGGLFACSQ